MAMLPIDLDAVKVIIKKKAGIQNYEQYCNDHFYYSEWRHFAIWEQRELFYGYIEQLTAEALMEDKKLHNLLDGELTISGDELYLVL